MTYINKYFLFFTYLLIYFANANIYKKKKYKLNKNMFAGGLYIVLNKNRYTKLVTSLLYLEFVSLYLRCYFHLGFSSFRYFHEKLCFRVLFWELVGSYDLVKLCNTPFVRQPKLHSEPIQTSNDLKLFTFFLKKFILDV